MDEWGSLIWNQFLMKDGLISDISALTFFIMTACVTLYLFIYFYRGGERRKEYIKYQTSKKLIWTNVMETNVTETNVNECDGN